MKALGATKTSLEIARDVRAGKTKLDDVALAKRSLVQRHLRTMSPLELGDPHELPSPGSPSQIPLRRARSG